MGTVSFVSANFLDDILKRERLNSCNHICDYGGEVWKISDHLNKMFSFKSSLSTLKYIFNINKTDNFQSIYIPCSLVMTILD